LTIYGLFIFLQIFNPVSIAHIVEKQLCDLQTDNDRLFTAGKRQLWKQQYLSDYSHFKTDEMLQSLAENVVVMAKIRLLGNV